MTDPAALGGLRIIDLGQGLAAPFAAKLLGDLGADVIKIEPPSGDAARRRGPFPDDAVDLEASAPFLYANTSKRSVVLDPDVADDRRLRDALIGDARIVIASETEPQLARRGIGFDDLRALNPSVILVTVSGFGSDGPYADWQWNNLIACAIGGFSHLCGRAEREPLQLGGSIPETLAGAYAAVAALIALRGQQAQAQPQAEHVDVSVLEAAVNMALLVAQRYEYTGQLGARRADIGPAPSFILPTNDGYIGANTLTQAQWEVMCQFFGRPELIEDPKFADVWGRVENSRQLADELAALTRDRSADEIFHEAQAWRIPFGLVPTLAEALDLLPHRERGFLFEFDHPRAGRVRMPGAPWMFGEQRPSGAPPPLLDQHGEEIRGGDVWRGAAPPAVEPVDQQIERPLEGLRVIDLSMFMSGPMTTMIFADAGADVIKVESVQRIDGWRAGGAIDIPEFWETAPQFNWVNRNKQGITLNLTDPRGADAIRTMVEEADILVENYTPRVMGNFGLAWDDLRAINPELIMLSMPGFGLTGSWTNYTAFANTTEQMSGLPHLTGYAGDQPIFSGTTGGDPLAGVMGALALLSALERRRRLAVEGQPGGCHIDLSQTETAAAYTGDALTAYAISGRDPGRVGNAHPRMAPHNTYPCRRDERDDLQDEARERWVAIACPDDDAFAKLAEACGHPEWASPDGRWRTLADRQRSLPELDAAIAEWTRERDAREIMRQLQAAGVPAAAVYHGLDLLEDEQLAARGFFITQEHRYAGRKRYPLQPYRFRHWPAPRADQPSPTLGRDTRAVLARLTDISPDTIDQWEREDVTGQTPIAARAD